MDIPTADLARLRDLYVRGRYRQALDAGAAYGPLRHWGGTPGRLLAGRLAMQLGAPRLGRKLHAAAYRSSPAYPEAVYYHARYRFERFGPLACRRFAVGHPDWSESAPDLRADWLALLGFVSARLKDADRADRYLAQAEAMAPHRPWIAVERAAALEATDRADEALASARRALELQPWFRPAVQAVAHLMHRRGETVAAVDFLREADAHLESGIVAAQRAALEIDLGRYTDARTSLERYAELSPLREPDSDKWLAARRADVAYLIGDYPTAAEQARTADDEFYTGFADRLSADPTPGRTVLPIEITAGQTPSIPELLSRYWQTPYPASPADAAPPLDGLPDAADRRRAEAAGWTCREFTLTADAAFTLIEAKVPFVVSLVEVGVSQPRLVVGADRVRQSILVLDGHERKPVEAPLGVLTARYAATGPRCMAAVPDGKPLPDIALPETDLYDALYRVQCALADRTFAIAAAAAVDLPDGRHAKQAAVARARALAHPQLLLDAIDALLADFPTEPTYVLTKAAALRELGRTAERRAILEVHGTKADTDPLLMQSLAQMLLADPRSQEEANRLLRRSIRLRPQAAAGYYLLASQQWERQEFTEAVELYRTACLLDDREDQFADAFARVTAATGHAPDALRLFQQKATRPPKPHPPAVRALFQALIDRDEPEQAFGMLDTAVEKASGGRESVSPALGELLLFRAESYAHRGRHAEAAADLAAAQPHLPPFGWHLAAAKLARLKPDPTAALEHARAALVIDPLHADTHRLHAVLLAETQGKPAARAAIAAAADQFPDYYPLARLRAELLSPDQDDGPLAAVRHLIELCPRDAWAHRQLALLLADRQRDTEAKAAIAAAGELEPTHPSHFAVLAHVHRRADRTADLLETYRTAIRHDVDHDLAVSELVHQSPNRAAKREALRFIAGELRRQPHAGDGLVAYRDQFLTFAAEADEDEPEEYFEDLLAELEQHLDDRPDLWQSWSLTIQQLALLQRLEEARELAEDATERFPLLAQLWSDLARVRGALEQTDERLDALRSAVAAAPGWPPASRELAEAAAEAGNEDEAIAVLERAAARTPTDPVAHAALADQLWQTGRSEEALERAKTAARLDPGFDAAWAMVNHWGDRLDRPEDGTALARELTTSRPGDVRGWLKLARMLGGPEQTDEALLALDQAVKLDPRGIEAHDMRAERLADVGRFEEALAAAKPPALVADLPLVLQGRAAWIEAQRGNFAAAIPPMQALVAVEPNYYWGWQQLAEWYNETGRHEGFLEAASELVRLKPDHPIPLTLRGEAKLKTGDRGGGKADLRDALRIAPQYAPAAAVLFDACLTDGEQRDARSALAVLQEHAAGPEVLVKQVQFAARTGDADGAARGLREIATSQSDGPPIPIQLAFAEMDSAGWGEKASEVLQEAWQSGEFSPWTPLYWLDTPGGQAASPGERLAATDAAIAAFPKFPAGYDKRAELLAIAGRYDEALAACRHPAAGDPPPIILRGRSAWVEARRGNRPKAISLMKQVVQDDPGYLWGWRNLAQWYDADGRHKECFEAADVMVRLSPDDPLAYGYRGEARRTLGDKRGAKADFRKAFDLDPSFDAAGLHLITELLETGETDEAARALSTLQEHASGPLVRLRAAQVAAKQGNLSAARGRLKGLATDPSAPRSVIRDAAEALDREGWAAEVDEELLTVIAGADASPAAAAVWADRLVLADRAWQLMDALPGLLERNPTAGREAVLGFAAGTATTRPDTTASTVHRFADHLRADTDSWARAGAALATARSFALAASWLADWADRDDVQAWMLDPLADALRALDRDAESLVVCKAAVELGGPGQALAVFRGWLAVDAAVGGRTDEAAGLLRQIDQVGLPDGTKLVIALAEAIVMVAQAGPDGKRGAFGEAKDHLKAASGACAEADVPPGACRWYKRVVTRMSLDAGGLGAKAWAAWQQVQPWVRG